VPLTNNNPLCWVFGYTLWGRGMASIEWGCYYLILLSLDGKLIVPAYSYAGGSI